MLLNVNFIIFNLPQNSITPEEVEVKSVKST